VTASLADAATAADLLDVFSGYDGNVLFRGLTESAGGQPPVLGRLGWIFTSLGAAFLLWGFVLRSRGGGGEKVSDVARTWVLFGFLIGGPFLMRAAMQASDSLYEDAAGGPRALATACVKAAYAMPELNRLFDVLRAGSDSQAVQSAGAQRRLALVSHANDGSVVGYLEAFGYALWDTAAGYAEGAGQSWSGLLRAFSMAAGLGSAMLKCLLIALTIAPLYLVLLAAGALIWFMDQLRYFLAVSGAMMLPMFVGMLSLPAGHFSRQAAQSYIMHMVSLALWPVAWAVGHVGTISLYNALISLVAGTSRVPEIASLLQWSSVSSGAPSEAQLRALEAALGNWFMGNLTGLLSILVGGIGFMTWVAVVSLLGPVFLHRLLTTGALFMSEAMAATARHGYSAARVGLAAAQPLTASGLLASQGAPAGERLAAAPAFDARIAAPGPGAAGASMASAARQVDDWDGKDDRPG
jgi:hypothetical protein